MATITDFKKKIEKCDVGEILRSAKLLNLDENKDQIKLNLQKIT
jgi:hypothetical protein